MIQGKKRQFNLFTKNTATTNQNKALLNASNATLAILQPPAVLKFVGLVKAVITPLNMHLLDV